MGTRLAYPGMQMTKTGPATVVAGSTITYTIRLGNNGTDSILNGDVVLVNDKLPLGDTFVSAAPVAGVADPVPCNASQTGLVTCSVKLTADLVNGTAPADGPAFNITATVDPLYVGDSTNYASIAPDGVSTPPTPGPPLCLGPNCGSTTVAVSTGASLELAKSGPATVIAGTSFNYTLSLGNGGTGPLAGGTVVQVVDYLPTGVTYLSEAPGPGVSSVVCTPSGGLVSCSVTLAANLVNETAPADGPEFIITVTAPSTASLTTNYASVPTDGTSTPPTPGPSCVTANCGSANTTATTEPRLVLEKGAPGTAVAGTDVTYSLNLGNLRTGDLPAGTVILLDDQLPAGATYVSSAGVTGVSAVSCTTTQAGLVSCSVTLTGALVAGTSAASERQFSITATAPTASGLTTNYAAVSTNGTATPPVPDASCTGPNCDAAPTNVTAVPLPLVKLNKTGPATIVAGSNVTYSIKLVNQGTAELPAGTVLRVDDQLPTGSAFVSAGTGSGVSSVSFQRKAVVLVTARLYLRCGCGACRFCGPRSHARPILCASMACMAMGECTRRCSKVRVGTFTLSDANSANKGADFSQETGGLFLVPTASNAVVHLTPAMSCGDLAMSSSQN